MTTSLDSGLPDGTNESPNSPSSTGSDQQNSGTGNITKADIESLQRRLDKFERDAQGNKDRAVKRTNERLDELTDNLKPLLEQAQKYIAKGSSVNEAIAQVQEDKDRTDTDAALREMARAWKSGQLPNSPQGSGKSEGVDVTAVLNDLGLDISDPLVKVAFEGKNFTEAEAEAMGARLLREKKRQPTPTQAQAPSQPGRPSPSPDGAQLTETYIKEMRGLVGKVNAKARDAVKERYKKLGVDIYSIDFTA